jgi:biopolymer transport protein ExbB
MHQFKLLLVITQLAVCLILSTQVLANDNSSSIYERILQERKEQATINKQREATFLERKEQKLKLLRELKNEHEQQKNALSHLKANIHKTNLTLESKKLALKERTHALRDLFSAWKEVIKDSKNNSQNSLISHQFPDQINSLNRLDSQTTLPATKDLEALWTLLQHDIKQTAQSTNYEGWVAQVDGSKAQQTIQRVGPFTASSQGKFLLHDAKQNTLSVAPKQANSQALSIIKDLDFQDLVSNSTTLAVIDPSRGVVLERLSLAPSWQDRIHQGGYIGYAIIFLGIAGLALVLARAIFIASTKQKIRKQLTNLDHINLNNPLGKIIAAYKSSIPTNEKSSHNTESLEVRLQEIVLQEMPRLDKGIGLLKLLAAVAPLLGLLGTVVGMINTFQTITLVGNADPKLMAGGISQALMTTVLGLIVAVPLLFSHSYLAARSRELMVFLSQQSLGYIAQSLEKDITSSKKES